LLPYHLGSVNCYLIETDTGYILIDTGGSNKRTDLERELASAGCKPGNLKLIVITHGDFDHTGNARYLREKYGTKIAIHPDDAGMLERGDMFWNRKKGNMLIRLIAPLLFGFTKSNRSQPDLSIEDGYDLSEYGFDAQVLSLPGHSKKITDNSTGAARFHTLVVCARRATTRIAPAVRFPMRDADCVAIERPELTNVMSV